MTSRYERNLRLYANDIRRVAQLKSQGIVPITLEREDPQAAADLAFLIGQLDDAGVMPAVEHLAAKIKKERAKLPKPTNPVSPTVKRQKNFFDLMGLSADPARTLDTKARLANPEGRIDKLHNPYIRAKLRRQESQKIRTVWIKFLRDVGARKTQAERRAMLGNMANDQVTLLKQLGVWNEIMEQGLTAEIIQKLRDVMNQPKRYRTDPASSEGITIYSSPLAMALHQIINSSKM